MYILLSCLYSLMRKNISIHFLPVEGRNHTCLGNYKILKTWSMCPLYFDTHDTKYHTWHIHHNVQNAILDSVKVWTSECYYFFVKKAINLFFSTKFQAYSWTVFEKVWFLFVIRSCEICWNLYFDEFHILRKISKISWFSPKITLKIAIKSNICGIILLEI